MKKIDTTNIAGLAKAPFIKATHDHIKESIQDSTGNIIKGLYGYTTNDIIILYGCVVAVTGGAIPGTGTATLTAGAAYYNGEIYEVDANAALSTTNPQTLIWSVVTTYRSGDPVEWSDGTSRDLHRVDKLQLTAGTVGAGLADYDASTVKRYDTGWTALTAQNSWALTNAAYRRIGNVVYLRGLFTADGDETNATMATLPVGARPTISQVFTASYLSQTSPSFSGVGNVIIPTAGTIGANGTISGFVVGTSSGTIYLDGISFPIA